MSATSDEIAIGWLGIDEIRLGGQNPTKYDLIDAKIHITQQTNTNKQPKKQSIIINVLFLLERS